MKKNHTTKINRNAPRIPKLDDYDLPAEFPFDPRKLKPNRFAGHVKFSHGGVRPGAGRKPTAEPVERHTITLYKKHVNYLKSLDTNLSRAIRKLIAKSQ